MGTRKREKNKLTKEAILKIMNKTEEDFKTKGASRTDMAKVFEHFNLPVRIMMPLTILFINATQ